MKIIFSRKGFDSSAGGCASPILDGRLVSLPIPDSASRITYADVTCGEIGSLGPIVESLTKGRIAAKAGAHLDPDLDADAVARQNGWRPIFGQVDAAQSHLLNQGVTKGDLFLMFGWFREAERNGKTSRFVPGAQDLHVLYGWLQIGDVFELGSESHKTTYPAWSHYHPHFYGTRGSNNVLYVASPTLILNGVDLGVPGAGRWPAFRPQLQLTDAEAGLRGTWRLPAWFDPARASEPLSYHAAPNRWQRLNDAYRLFCVGRGQEFVFDTEVYPEAISWIRRDLFARSLSRHNARRRPVSSP
ncbi:MAG TPA: hypothetical protein VGZ00_09990 [Candidatus Baltobacteraceae bacterium]|jgi:hypothetical protein|nr:hypothetical protein [Candidatus Baltobacteraceae bacterium]